ncbi:glycoside hydrolase family 18 protein [Gonapodya prolifera JEL478]|uniref:Glycoside hydrolase family 18 protein n=1 Tax=Gonapodya prolifera (strain JEL478) TaxID=1344416 RepID=A0A138ZXB4_GONPJ|nr:glycoside hydrolase family 18 protein [Gonapodya prolifera JEL478]|eukprot:KXS09129.1 glycoside hydrolase family 18 protein [Gonapodya prolifera JEL478]
MSFSGLNFVLYAFWQPNADGTISSLDTWADLQIGGNGMMLQLNTEVKPQYPGMKTLLAVGGYTLSSNFAAIAASKSLRDAFAESCLSAVKTYGFDGIDIDWEFPASATEASNFALLVAALRSHLGTKYYISLAMSVNLSVYGASLLDITKWADFVNLMTYDFGGPWDTYTSLNAPLYHDTATDPNGDRGNVAGVVNAYKSAGVGASKMTVGVALYGHSVRMNCGVHRFSFP